MLRYKLTLSYDGTQYSGWQKQPELPTIQGTLEAAITRLFGEKAAVTGSGRTDAGVHALAQIAHVDLKISIDPANLRTALNSHLPPDIRVQEAHKASETFHARYDAKRRTYIYLIKLTSYPSPFLIRYALQTPPPLNVAAMRRAAHQLVGTHNFSAFSASGGAPTCPIRTIFQSEIFPLSESLLCYLVVADAFLRRMVRGIVGTLLEIGRGKSDPEVINMILTSGDRSLLGTVAPPQGLYLFGVSYSHEDSTSFGDSTHE